jgi:hypothetical protein
MILIITAAKRFAIVEIAAQSSEALAKIILAAANNRLIIESDGAKHPQQLVTVHHGDCCQTENATKSETKPCSRSGGPTSQKPAGS